MKKLYRNEENKIVSGILGGIAEYLEIDPVVIRVLFVLITVLTGFFPAMIFYVVSLFIIPKKVHLEKTTSEDASQKDTDESSTTKESDIKKDKTLLA